MKFTQKITRTVTLLLSVLLLTSAAWAGERMLIPGGHTIGLKAYSQGLVVTEVSDGSPAKKAGIRKGDILCSLGDVPLTSVEQLTKLVSSGETLHISYTRGKEACKTDVTPQKTADGYRLGAFVRDHIAGIGTVSYYDAEDGTFGALGHAISDLSGTAVLPIQGGEVISSRVREVVKGVSGTAGQLKGEFDASIPLGTIEKNTAQGVFGTVRAAIGNPIPVAEAREVKAGRAQIYSNVQGDSVEAYDIEILKCFDPDAQGGRNLLIRVVDEDLLTITGGIVQGMSGSPIIQDGKLVGAVTHVLVNTPHMGYGIYLENMLSAA